ncbi:MAG: hypothetical protein IOD12_09615 [Silvanigrellales bacterium]|nr:hypothetical protein [Silvanigrellales bacterium]
MSAASNRPPKSISETDAAEIARRVASLEERWPLEVRVVVSSRGGRYPFGAIRFLALVFVAVEFVTWGLWVAVPAWTFHVLILGLLFLGGQELGRLPFSRFFTSREERRENVEHRAHQAFARADVANTTERNGLLLYFSMPEKMFYLLPDAVLARSVSAAAWQTSVEGLHAALVSAPKGKALSAAIFHLLDDLEAKARVSLTPRPALTAVNELPNTVVFEDA